MKNKCPIFSLLVYISIITIVTTMMISIIIIGEKYARSFSMRGAPEKKVRNKSEHVYTPTSVTDGISSVLGLILSVNSLNI